MEFQEVLKLVINSCPLLCDFEYDGIIVKKLAATNTISDTGASHQSHIAYTGKQKDFFPFLEADGYFNVGYERKDDDLKKYFTLQIPLNIYEENVESLKHDISSQLFFTSKSKTVKASVLRSRRNGADDQIELSIKSLDDKDFIEFRKLLRVGDFFVILKRKNELKYDLVGISANDKNADKLSICTDFYKIGTQTPVGIENFEITSASKAINYQQIIYYGVPGSGKSYAIDKIVKELESQPLISNVKYIRRVVFHPEYTNADFIGQILPEMKNGVIHYNFVPGHFTKILKDAYRNPDKNFALVIEEINRGNAAAIFGDIFQLLDRLNETESDYSANDKFTYTCGWSKYGIDNTDIIYEIFKNKEGKFEPLCLRYGEDILHINYNTAIRLPPNLSIYATMNTSDQNVFTLDNAFQRRWDMQLVKNECNDSKQMDSKITIKDKYITWKDFQEQINKVIGEKSNESGLSSMEDKRLGCWFVKAENGAISAEKFANKVLKYLWDDAFKFYHTEIFKEGIKNFEDLQKEFLNNGFDVFNDVCELQDKIQSLSRSTTSDSQVETE